MTNDFHAIDPARRVHTRSSKSGCIYTHIVVTKPSYQYALMHAQSKDWTKTDRRNFEYYVTIAQGRDPYPRKNSGSVERGNTAKEIEEELIAVQAENKKRVEDAIATLANRSVAQWLADKLQERLDRVEKLKADGYYDSWHNAGWCGRFELAQKLAHAEQARQSVAESVVLEARPGKPPCGVSMSKAAPASLDRRKLRNLPD